MKPNKPYVLSVSATEHTTQKLQCRHAAEVTVRREGVLGTLMCSTVGGSLLITWVRADGTSVVLEKGV